MMIEDREKLVTFLCVALRNFTILHLALQKLKASGVPDRHVTFDAEGREPAVVPLRELCMDTLTGALAPQKEIFENCRGSLSRAVLAETFELIKAYCDQTGQLNTFKAWPTYNFARIVRNCTSHGVGGILTRWPGDLKKQGIVSVTWQGIMIDESMLGERIAVFNPDIVRLVVEELEFVKSELS